MTDQLVSPQYTYERLMREASDSRRKRSLGAINQQRDSPLATFASQRRDRIDRTEHVGYMGDRSKLDLGCQQLDESLHD